MSLNTANDTYAFAADPALRTPRTYEAYQPVRVFGGFRLALVVSYRTDDGWEEDYEFDWTRPVYATEAEALVALAPVQARAA